MTNLSVPLVKGKNKCASFRWYSINGSSMLVMRSYRCRLSQLRRVPEFFAVKI